MEQLIDRFLRYVSVDTQSNPESESQPSAAKELDLLMMLKDELEAMGVEAKLDEYGYVMATIPSNCGKDVPAVGFIAHVDTAPDASGKDIKPQIIKNYDGGDIALKGVEGLYLKVEDFPEMKDYEGQTLITTDGTTLLGADDKAGVAEIMDAVQYIIEHPELKHGKICIGFTPDEEIGRGVVKFDVEKFGADYAYTMDGGAVGELEYENFNAASASVKIQGSNLHPGYAKGKMKNAILIGMELWSKGLNTPAAMRVFSISSASTEASRRPLSHILYATTIWTSTKRGNKLCRSAWISSTGNMGKARPAWKSSTSTTICARWWSHTTIS